VCLIAGQNRIPLAKLATLRVTLRVSNFLSDPLKTRNAAKSRRMSALDWRADGLDPATSGVTGRRANRFNDDPAFGIGARTASGARRAQITFGIRDDLPLEREQHLSRTSAESPLA
jgi:hypothetical protein